MDSKKQDPLTGADNMVSGVNHDVPGSEIAMLERRASIAEQRAEALKTALESARAGYWEWNTENDTFHIDSRWAAFTGHTPDELAPLTLEKWRELCNPDDLDQVNTLMEEYLDDGEGFLELELRVRHKSGEWIQVLDRGKISERDRNGKPLRLTGSRQADIKQHHGVSESQDTMALEELLTLFDNIPGAIYHIDASGQATIRSRPPAFLKALILEHHRAPLFNTLSMIHNDDRQMVAEAYRKLKEAKHSLTLVYRVVTPGGKLRWIEDHKRSNFSEEGLFTGIDGFICDISDRLSTKEEALRLESQLRKSQRLETIGTLAGGIAHDFNNILTPIIGYAEMGLSGITESDPMHEYFNEIMLAAERAQKLVAQILTFSRAEENKAIPVSLKEIVTEALQLLRSSFPSTITIEEHIDNACHEVLADPAQMHQLIVNLCTNAFHAMELTGGVLSIGLREIVSGEMPSTMPKLLDDNYVELTVSDTGTGMDETTIEHIFEPFFTTKSIEKGSGLGLSVVHGIVTGANGQLRVESVKGKGSTFHVYLPMIGKKVTAMTEEKPPQAKYSANVLFIDDEPAAVHMVTIMMTKLGFNIRAEQSPVDALKLFREQPDQFDLVITDLTMPEMTGIQLASELHKISSSIPVILMTGYGKIINHDTPLSYYGITRLLKKPVKLAQLASAVNQVLSSTNSSKPL